MIRKIFPLSAALILIAFSASAQDAIQTDRPGRMMSTSSVAEGVYQVEIGMGWTEPSGAFADLVPSNFLINETVLRTGITETAEIRIGNSTSESDGTTNRSLVGIKQMLFGPNSTLQGAVNATWHFSTSDPFEGYYAEIMIPLAFQINDKMSFAVMPGITDDLLDQQLDRFDFSSMFNYSWGPKFTQYVQMYYEVYNGMSRLRRNNLVVPGTGGMYLINERSQLDFSIEFQSNQLVDYVFVGLGYSLLINRNE